MTIAVAIHVPGKGTWVGTDTRATMGNLVVSTAVVKHARVGEFVILQAGHPRTISLIDHNSQRLSAFKAPFQLVSEIRQLMQEDGYTEDRHEEGPTNYGQNILIASPEGVWDVDAAFSVVPVEAGMMASAGSGTPYALGADYAVFERSPEYRIRTALESAAQFDVNCGDPFYVEFLKLPKKRSK